MIFILTLCVCVPFSKSACFRSNLNKRIAADDILYITVAPQEFHDAPHGLGQVDILWVP
jgi:hypothetical protein